MNALGLYLLVSLVFVVLALLEFVLVVLLNRVASPIKKSNFDENGRRNDTDVNSKALQGRKMPAWQEELAKVKYRKIKIIPDMPSIHIVDLMAFCMFVFLFGLFNFIYWMVYIM